jgi:hypothetical protein
VVLTLLVEATSGFPNPELLFSLHARLDESFPATVRAHSLQLLTTAQNGALVDSHVLAVCCTMAQYAAAPALRRDALACLRRLVSDEHAVHWPVISRDSNIASRILRGLQVALEQKQRFSTTSAIAVALALLPASPSAGFPPDFTGNVLDVLLALFRAVAGDPSAASAVSIAGCMVALVGWLVGFDWLVVV